MAKLNTAFHSLADWDAFYKAATADPKRKSTAKWAKHWDKRMRVQTDRRASLPAHYSTGAVEPRIADIRQMLERRSWTFRNLPRMNLLLELVRIHLNRQDDPQLYARLIREHLQANNGKPTRSRNIYDQSGSSLRA